MDRDGVRTEIWRIEILRNEKPVIAWLLFISQKKYFRKATMRSRAVEI